MQCPECNTPNRDDAAFCGMCKKLFRTAPPRSSRPPPPPSSPSSPSGFWHALLERLSGAPPAPPATPADAAALQELGAALHDACPSFWCSAELRISPVDPRKSIVARGDDPHEHLDLTPRLVGAIQGFVRAHASGTSAGRGYLVVVERQRDGQWTIRWAVQ